jgi:hypothetical protein
MMSYSVKCGVVRFSSAKFGYVLFGDVRQSKDNNHIRCQVPWGSVVFGRVFAR